eukprot:3164342-Rhodomonas_salina.1
MSSQREVKVGCPGRRVAGGPCSGEDDAHGMHQGPRVEGEKQTKPRTWCEACFARLCLLCVPKSNARKRDLRR